MDLDDARFLLNGTDEGGDGEGDGDVYAGGDEMDMVI